MLRITNAARNVLEKLGKGDFSKGLAAVHHATGINPIQIRRWTYPAERGGTNGRIPRKHHAAIVTAGKRIGVAIAPEEFYPAPIKPASAKEKERPRPVSPEARVLRRIADQLDAELTRGKRAAGAR